MRIYREDQHLRRPAIVIALIVTGLGLVAGIVYILSTEDPFRTNEGTYLYVVLSFMITIYFLSIWLMLSIALALRVDEYSFSYRLKPFMGELKRIQANEISNYSIVNYRPVKRGIGIKWSPKYGRIYFLRGRMGLQLVLKSGKKMLFSTRKPDEFMFAMNKMMKPNK